jgi:cell surface protein SprA
VDSFHRRIISSLRRRRYDAALLASALSGVFLLLIIPRQVDSFVLPPVEAFSPAAPDSIPVLLDSLALLSGSDTLGRSFAKDTLALRHMLDSLTTRVDSLRRDSLAHAGPRKLVISDSSYVVCLDSTERLEQFVYHRTDPVAVPLDPRRTYPLFADVHLPALRREESFDSLGQNVLLRETLDGVDVKVPVSVPFDDYIALKRKQAIHDLFAAEARKQTTSLAKSDLGDVLSNITKINIPVPPNPLFSIFGKNEINLNVTGSVAIKAGFRNTKTDQATISSLDQSRSEPDFSQEVQVNVNGTIGDKLNILADWNTKRTFEYENQLKIKYTGYDDEIVQSVEAGNVSLQTPSSFIGSSQALFGVKAKFQMGPLTLTTLASQKKGQIKEVSVSGGSQEQTFEMQAFEYSTNHFFVDPIYRQGYEEYYQSDVPSPDPNRQIVEAEVWVQWQGNTPDPNKRLGVARIDLPPRPGSGYADSMRADENVPGQIESGYFTQLDPTQYELDGDGYLGELSLNTNVSDAQIVAIAYRRADGTQYGEFARNISFADTSNRIVLKMVKPRNLLSVGPTYKVAWDQLLKNIYPVQGIGRNLKKQGFTLDVYRKVPGGEDQNTILNERLLRILGVDKYADDTPSPTGDGVFDFRPSRTINVGRAEIIFPYLRPFDTGISEYFQALNGQPLPDTSEYRFKEVYDTTQTFAQQSLRNRYVIKGKATGEASSRYSLGFNVVEGSVQVILDGRPLLLNVDYTVDYIVGEIVIKNPQALVPGANLQIKYEQNDLFQLASKTLLGVRGDLAISPTTSLGFTMMNLNQQTLSDKVRLGEEPNNNTILGIDGSTTMDLPFLTDAIDALPIVSTHQPSSLKISGEAAYMMPDPNTKKSTIGSDGGEGVAYVDDFEGARRTIPVGVNFLQWTQASPPADSASNAALGDADTTKMSAKGKLVWYNRLPTNVRVTDVYPRKKVGNEANNQLTVFDLHYFPTTRGQFNYSTALSSTLTPTRNWGGIMKPLSISAINLLKENIDFIEIWMYVQKAQPGEKMYIDLGAISEDVIPNHALNSEDLILSNNPNGVLQEGEDVGLDMLTDDQERAKYPSLGGDPSGDDYAYNNSDVGTPREDYTHINGTENNKDGPGGRIPDTEDINANGIVDLANSYFEYELPLDTVAGSNQYIVGGGDPPPVGHGYYQFRIPIRDFIRKVGSPTPENIEYIRVFFRNSTDTTIIRIADFNLVGSQWQKLSSDQTDSTLQVSVVGIEENPNYVSPPGVQRERDLTRPDEDVQANEQSLVLKVKNLKDGDSRQAVKFYSTRPLDLFDYRTMKMFVHGDDRFRCIDTTTYDAAAFFRFGVDSLNYYEYREPVRPGWDPLNDIVIRFQDLTAIKQTRDSVNKLSDPVPVPGGPPGSTYRVLGNPSLTQITYLAVGVENPLGKGNTNPLDGEIWFDELRLTSVDNTRGWAYRFDTQLKLADLASVSFNYSRVDPYFHSLEQRFGSRQMTRNWALSSSISFERFLPESWAGTTIPFSYTHTESFTNPLYLPNSDIDVVQAAEQQRQKAIRSGLPDDVARAQADSVITVSQSRRVSDTYAAPSFHIQIPSTAWYIRDTFDKLTFGFTYTKSSDRNPALVYSNAWSWNARIAYSLTLPPDYFVQPFKHLFDGMWFLDEYKDLKLFFPLTGFNWAVNAARSRSRSLQRTQGAVETVSRQFTASRSMGFGWKLTEGGLLNPSGDYSLSINSTLLSMELDPLGRQRSFSEILRDIFFGSRLVNFGDDLQYSQHNGFNTKPAIPNIFNIKKYLDLSFSYSVDYSWTNTLTRGDLGKSSGYSNNINAQMNLRLKQLFDPLFESGPSHPSPPPSPRGRRTREPTEPDTTETHQDTTAQHHEEGGISKTLGQLKELAKTFIKIPFLDYDIVNIGFTQTNSAQNNGVVGSGGFVNFWGRVPFLQSSLPENGPSRLYQLGLISDPSGRLTNFGTRSKFPFFGWDVEPGIRAKGGLLVNTYRQQNRLTFKTSRELWKGARLDLNWNVGWSYSRTQNLITDTLTGIPVVQNQSITGTIDRSFLTFPDVLFLGTFKTSLKEVSKRYAELKNGEGASASDEENLNRAFEEGFEALPFLRKIFGEYLPRVNWSLHWDGLEHLPMFTKFVNRLSLDHSYTSSYSRQFENLPGGGGERINGQHVGYGFTPLIGLNFTFKELAKGNVGANVRYNTNTSYDLATSSRNIVESLTQEISITASYSRRGFEIPFFGLSLSNDIDISASYSVSKNSKRTYDVSKIDVDVRGTPLEGSTRTVLEPRIKYVLSQRVTASVYYRYTSIAPDDAGSRIPGSTTNEAGLDLQISIQ